MSRSKNLLVPDFSIICCFERVPLDSWYRYRSRDKMVGDPKKSTRDISFEQFVLEWADGSPLGGGSGRTSVGYQYSDAVFAPGI